MLPDDTMGHEDNIVEQHFEQLAKKKGKSTEEIKHWVLEMLEKSAVTDPDVQEMFLKASHAWGQPVKEAEYHTKELLKETLRH
jgi:hypothetical protein